VELAKGCYPYPPETFANVFAQLTAIVHGPAPTLPSGYSQDAHDFVAKWSVVSLSSLMFPADPQSDQRSFQSTYLCSTPRPSFPRWRKGERRRHGRMGSRSSRKAGSEGRHPTPNRRGLILSLHYHKQTYTLHPISNFSISSLNDGMAL
jgi:hypothetical protein